MFPADAVSTPRSMLDFGALAIAFAAPLILKDPIGWRFSNFKKTSCSTSAFKRTKGVRDAIPAMLLRASVADRTVVAIYNKFTLRAGTNAHPTASDET
jgi:hypothetical protein